MSVRQSLLALLDQGPSYGYQLRAEFERRTGSTWPLNIGQVYSTLERLERDGQVEHTGADDEGHQMYRITDRGSAEVIGWLGSPVVRSRSDRDELAMKLALAVTLPRVDVEAVIQVQRSATLRQLQDLTAAKNAGGEPDSVGELAWSFISDSLIFQAEAEVRWLDHTEARMRRVRETGALPVSGPSPHVSADLPAEELR